MEFKGRTRTEERRKKRRINRIRLEFKVQHDVAGLERRSVLIESDWNLKPFLFPTTRKIARINRIRLEFKDENMVAEPSVGRTGINRIRLEFKGHRDRGAAGGSGQY